MRIESSELFMKSEHTYVENKLVEEHLHYWDKNVNVQADMKEIKLTISEQAQKMYEQTASQAAAKTVPTLGTSVVEPTPTPTEEVQFELSDKDKQKILLLQAFIESLSGKKYAFDLDSDGQEDQISFANNQSGFLALDLNEDGMINNGSELFGALTGDGYDSTNRSIHIILLQMIWLLN